MKNHFMTVGKQFKKKWKITSVGKDVEKLEPSYTAEGT